MTQTGSWSTNGGAAIVRALFKRTQAGNWRVGFMPADRETALAIVRMQKGSRPLLRHCAVHPAIEIRAEHVLAPVNHSRDLVRAPVSAVLSSQDYQLVQVEAPDVQPSELRSAVRWSLRDILNYPVSEAVVDVFDIPEKARYVESQMIFAVAAHSEAIKRVVNLVKPRARGFDVIDIPELCLRNLTSLLPQDEHGTALLALGEGFAQLVLTCQGSLYLARRIDLTKHQDSISIDGGEESNAQALAIELQRSLNYYESHYDRAPIANVFVASGDARAEQLLEPLRTETGLDVELFDIEEFFEVAPGVEPDTHFPGLCALGAALRANGSTP
jgi:MSHA biogenesis protein MshI